MREPDEGLTAVARLLDSKRSDARLSDRAHASSSNLAKAFEDLAHARIRPEAGVPRPPVGSSYATRSTRLNICGEVPCSCVARSVARPAEAAREPTVCRALRRHSRIPLGLRRVLTYRVRFSFSIPVHGTRHL
jgi:hypothetical protein